MLEHLQKRAFQPSEPLVQRTHSLFVDRENAKLTKQSPVKTNPIQPHESIFGLRSGLGVGGDLLMRGGSLFKSTDSTTAESTVDANSPRFHNGLGRGLFSADGFSA